jgi:predicted MFS family arabinose efflux permease
MYLWGGLATLVTLTVFGRLADRFGKLPVFWVLGLLTAVPILLSTNLAPGLHLGWVLAVTTLFMVVASGRMVPAMALITASSAPRYRGSFMSVNSSVQQLALALAAILGGLILGQSPAGEGGAEASGPLTGYDMVGWLAAGVAVLSVYLGGRLRSAVGGLEAVDLPVVLPDVDLSRFEPASTDIATDGVQASEAGMPLCDAIQDAAPLV